MIWHIFSFTEYLQITCFKQGLPIVLDVDDDDGGDNNDEYDDDEAHIVEKTENKFPE